MENTESVTTAALLRRMQDGWDALQAYIATLTPEQLSRSTDRNGWTIKDHLIHLAVWEDGIEALLSGQSRRERMGVDLETWKSNWLADSFFRINDVIYRQHKHKSLETVLAEFNAVHDRMMKTVAALSDSDLMRPYRDFDSTSSSETPIYVSIEDNSFGHYAEHRPWIEAIAARN